MKTVDDYLRAAWQALLLGDLKRRDELCRQAERLMSVDAEEHRSLKAAEQIEVGQTVICLPDQSAKVVQ